MVTPSHQEKILILKENVASEARLKMSDNDLTYHDKII